MSRKAYRTRIANGQGSVRKKIITRKGGKKYELWEARYNSINFPCVYLYLTASPSEWFSVYKKLAPLKLRRQYVTKILFPT